MFHVNEALNGMGTLTVKNGEMNIHISLASKGILNLYPGLAKDAEKAGAILLEPTTDTVTYSDGTNEEVYGFDVPVPALDTEFDLALIGKKGKWYDHKVSVKSPAIADGSYNVKVDFEGGSGKAFIESPATVVVKDGEACITVTWSSKNYDYMIVDGVKYMNEAKEGNPSQFTFPIAGIPCDMDVIGDTVAMSTPHEIEYTIHISMDK